MPKLSELTDVNYTGEYDPMGNALPVEKLYPELQRVYVNEPSVEQPSKGSIVARGILDKLFGQTGERYQLWPEKIVRDALSAAHDVKEGKELSNIGLRREDVTDKPVPQRGDKPDMPGVLTSVAGGILTPTASSPQDSIIEKAQAISALAGTGGLAGGAEGSVLNATPSLRPALKHKERLYKGKPGQEHQDIIPDSLYNDFQKKAMSGEDLAEYNFGFINDKGHFMSREDALKYGIDNGIIDPHSGKYGALTTTLLSDSSKPGVAIESLAKTAPNWSMAKNIDKSLSGKVADAIDTWVGGPHNSLKTGFGGGVWHPGKLKEILKNPELKSQLDEAIKPFKDDLRAKYGDTVPLYRYHGKLPDGAKSDRELLSFSFDPSVPNKMAGIKKDKSLFSDKDIAAKEKEFEKTGEVKVGKYTLKRNEYGSLDIDDPSVGGFLTDTPSVSAWMKELNAETSAHNLSQANKSKLIYKKDIPIDDIVYATDRFGQKEFIVKNNGTLFADSSKPGTAIEAMAKSYPLAKPTERWTNTTGQNDH